ncbi:MAG TPA: LLM class flavin-dependent oxidoreductase [Candidatus Dormibacteraeota bacterium]|nr:LLM class flavin-dependent oxidoreductase [Candidatus Dormibacteraeota bacterium]
MRLGLTLPFEDASAGDTAPLIRRAESIGYEEAWSYERDFFDAFTPLAAAATATERIRIGTAVVPALTRPPALIAMSAASLSHLAPGRFVLGLGTSTKTVVNGWMGLEWSEPVARTRKALLDIRRLLDGDRVGSFRLYRPPPLRVPVYLAALGPRMLRLAGQLADGVVLFMAGPGVVPRVSHLAGERLDLVARVVTVTGSSSAAAHEFARRFIALYASLPAYSRFLALQGFGEEVVAIQSRWRSGDRRGAAAYVSDAMVRELMWVTADFAAGDIAERYARAGLGCLDLWLMSPGEGVEQRRQDFDRALAECAAAARSMAVAGSE